jgi:hypothetical protein
MSTITRNWIHSNGWIDRPGHGARPGDQTPRGDGSHGPGGIYLDNGSTGWNCSENVFENVTVWALACYTTGIDNNSFTENTAVCSAGSSWCGPLGPKVKDCEIANNSMLHTPGQFTAVDLGIIAGAGPRRTQAAAASTQ